MAMLPVEVVEYIFYYLNSLEDRKAASLVCQQWYRAYLNPHFRLYEIVNITADKQLKTILEVENYHRMYLFFVMKNIDVTEDSLPFWERFGRKIKELTFHSCYIREKMFVKAVSKCKKLESLTVHDCKELFMAGFQLESDEDKKSLQSALQNLLTLNLGFNRYLSDATLLKFLNLCPNVTSLILNGCQVSYHRGIVRRFYPHGMQTASDSVTTFPMLLNYLRPHAARFKRISLCDTFMDNESLSTLSTIEGLKLDTLDIRSCVQISNQGIIQMTPHMTSLTSLDISLCERLTDTALIVICYSLTSLTRLSVQGCTALTDNGLANIWQLAQLQHLNLSQCDQLRGQGILLGLCHKTNFIIRELYLSQLTQLCETVLVGIAESLPNLRILDLSSCNIAVTDHSLQAIFEHLKWLRQLNLAHCDKITDSGMTGIGVRHVTLIPSVAQLKRLPLGSKHEQEIVRQAKLNEAMKRLRENEEVPPRRTGISIIRLQGLQRLNLTGCKSVSDYSLKTVFNHHELKALDMSHCPLVTSDGISDLVRNCCGIEELNLDMCVNIDDKAVECIMRDLSRLKSIVLGSNFITNDISLYIQNNALQLTYIDIRHCKQITGTGVGHLFHSLPYLQTFHYPETRADNEGLFPRTKVKFWKHSS